MISYNQSRNTNYLLCKCYVLNRSSMDDFNDSLWGDDDIDEALLIEASQQVEAETVSKVNKH